MAAIISVPYQISATDDAIVESWDPPNGAVAIVKFHCLWKDRYRLVKDLVGTFTGTAPGTIVRTPPFAYPPSPNLFCVGIEAIEKLGKPVPMPGIGLPWLASTRAVVVAKFGVPQWNVTGTDAYTRITFGSSGEFLDVPETVLYFQDGTPTNVPMGILIPQMEITVERNRMPFLPIQVMVQCQSRVNNAPFQISGVPFDTGTLLFLAGQSDFQMDPTGAIAYSQEYKFLARPMPWNNALHPNGTTGFAPIRDLAGNPPYGSANFTLLP